MKQKKALYAAVTVIAVLLLLEALASWVLVLRMRLANSENFTRAEPTYFSLLNIPYQAGLKFGLFTRSHAALNEYRIQVIPSPGLASDAELGYKPLPGKFQIIFSRRAHDNLEWKRLRVNLTRRNDGTRWTGECESSSRTNVYIFGDSFVAGYGVNDEQTFSFLLQLARKDMCVKLFAVEGYGMTQSFIQFYKLINQITPNDIVILGYADYVDTRTVVAPSRLREVRDWSKLFGNPVEHIMLPKAALDDQGAIHIAYVQQHCDENGGYCDQVDPPKYEMSHITALLINEIAETSSAPVYLLHFDGTRQNPIFGLLSGSVRKISALEEDSDDFIRDDVSGFDHHPGPYWHYAIGRKLIETFAQRKPERVP
jgi:hypothetical protein